MNEVSIKFVIIFSHIRSKIPEGNAQREVMNMGKRLTGHEALQLKIIDEVAKPSELLDRAKSLAECLIADGGFDREAMLEMKRQVYNNVVDSLNIYNHLPPYYLKSNM